MINIRQAIRALKHRSIAPSPDGYFTFLVHPLSYLQAVRGVHSLFNYPDLPRWQELAEQTEADYFGWGINGTL